MKCLCATLLALLSSTNALIVHHDFNAGVKQYTYQTFSGVAMYAEDEAPSKAPPGKGESFIKFDLKVKRTETDQASAIELIVIPDTNINDIGIRKDGELYICCTEDLVPKECAKEDKDKLIVNKDINGLYRYEIHFDEGVDEATVSVTDAVQVTAIHVFAMASCRENIGDVTFHGKSVWMNPYGHLPGDVYGYLPFYGWMCIAYLIVAVGWFCLNAIYWKELLYVQNCVTGVLALCLIEMGTWYFDYLHLNSVGTRHHGPFILGLITTVSRRMVSRMLVVAVSMGYGVVKPTLGQVKNKLIALGCIYWVFAFMFEALIHYNQTEKVETWMRVVLIPPVAIVNGIFWWWTFVSLNRTIETLKIRKQTAKLQLYKSFTLVLVAALIAAIIFAIYEMYYVLKELYFAEWERLWFMEVGFWQILFSVIFIAIMILWKPSQHSKTYAYAVQIGQEDDDEMGFGKPDTFADDDEDMSDQPVEPKFTIDDELEEDMHEPRGDAVTKVVSDTLGMGDDDEEVTLVTQKID